MSNLFGRSKKTDISDEIDAIKSELGDITGRISRLAGAAGESLRDNVEQLRSHTATPAQLRDSAYQIRDRASDMAQSAMSQGRDWLGTAESEVAQGWKQARGTVQQNPMLGLAVAAGIGFLIGIASRR